VGGRKKNTSNERRMEKHSPGERGMKEPKKDFPLRGNGEEKNEKSPLGEV